MKFVCVSGLRKSLLQETCNATQTPRDRYEVPALPGGVKSEQETENK